MKRTYILLLTLTLVYLVEPKLQLDVSWHSCTEIVANVSLDSGIFTIVSDSEALVCRQGVLSLLNASGMTLGETNLRYQPDKLTAYKLIEDGIRVIHIAASTNTGEQSSPNRISYCRFFYSSGRFSCRRYHPPTYFVAAVSITIHNQVWVYAVYFDSYGNLESYNVKHQYTQDSVALPQNCTCNSSRCLAPVDEPKGRTIVQCDNGDSYLYETYNADFIVLPPGIKLVATSNYRDMVLAAQRDDGLHQDIAVESNMVTDLHDASAMPLEGSLANSSNPITIQGVCIVSVNETSELEVGYILRNDKMLYFKLDELGIYPTIEHLSPPPHTTWVGIRGDYESFVVAEASYSNGTSVLVTIKASLVQLENETVDDAENSTDIPPSTNTITPQNISNSSTEPCVPEKPMATTNVTNGTVNSSTSADDSHKNIEPAYIVCAFIAGVISTLSVVAIVMILCRFKKSGKLNVNDAT